jgi:hypothetical protein
MPQQPVEEQGRPVLPVVRADMAHEQGRESDRCGDGCDQRRNGDGWDRHHDGESRGARAGQLPRAPGDAERRRSARRLPRRSRQVGDRCGMGCPCHAWSWSAWQVSSGCVPSWYPSPASLARQSANSARTTEAAATPKEPAQPAADSDYRSEASRSLKRAIASQCRRGPQLTRATPSAGSSASDGACSRAAMFTGAADV